MVKLLLFETLWDGNTYVYSPNQRSKIFRLTTVRFQNSIVKQVWLRFCEMQIFWETIGHPLPRKQPLNSDCHNYDLVLLVPLAPLGLAVPDKWLTSIGVWAPSDLGGGGGGDLLARKITQCWNAWLGEIGIQMYPNCMSVLKNKNVYNFQIKWNGYRTVNILSILFTMTLLP